MDRLCRPLVTPGIALAPTCLRPILHGILVLDEYTTRSGVRRYDAAAVVRPHQLGGLRALDDQRRMCVPSPFPGMDPYLEHPALWPGVHNGLIAALQLSLAPQLRPRYYVALEERLYITEPDQRVFVGRPDLAVIGQQEIEAAPKPATSEPSVLTVQVPVPDEVRETYLEVRETGTNYVVTVLEILSPTNKRPGRGRRIYEDKRMEVLASRTHLVEIDLIRAGEPMPIMGNGSLSAYRILVSRGDCRPNATLYTFGVRQPIPLFPLPLKPGDQEPTVEVGGLLHELYDRASYDLRIDYRGEPDPPLPSADASWADQVLHQKALR